VRALPPGEQRQDLLLPGRKHRQLDLRAGLGRLAPWAQRPPHARDELVRVDRLDEVVVGAEQKAGDAVVGLGAFARDEDDRQLLSEAVAELLVQLEAARSGQDDVYQ